MGLLDLFKRKQSNHASPVKGPSPKLSSHEIEYIRGLLNQAQDCTKLINETVNPDVFFGRLNFLLDLLLTLQEYEKFGVFKGSRPSEDFRKITLNLDATVNDFIDRALAANQKKIDSLKTQNAKNRNYTSFVIALIGAFDASHSFWSGNTGQKHYTGPLFTDKNYARVQSLFDGLGSAPDDDGALEKAKEKAATPNLHATLACMRKILPAPYVWDQRIKKHSVPYGRGFEYMDLSDSNVQTVKKELGTLNDLLACSHELTEQIPGDLRIPVNDLLFTPASDRGYTRLVCTPYTPTGKIAKYPIHLDYTTDMSRSDYTTHGEAYYGQNGRIQKAVTYCWRDRSGYFVHFRTVNDQLFISKIEVSRADSTDALPAVVYKA